MKVSEYRDLTPEELNQKMESFKGELFNLRFQLATNQLENPNKIGEVKKNIARVRTVIREREITASQQ
jgi:ribosomal protein L29